MAVGGFGWCFWQGCTPVAVVVSVEVVVAIVVAVVVAVATAAPPTEANG